MKRFEGSVREIQLVEGGATAARIACPEGAIPAPGRYLLAWAPEAAEAPLATPLFTSQVAQGGFLAAPPLPAGWQPGTRLALRGPLGRGFALPETARRLALAALGDTARRLLPLVELGLKRSAAAAFFADCPLPPLPLEVEVHPLGELADSLGWADWLAVDLPLEALPRLAQALGVGKDGLTFAPPGQALVSTPIPCGGAGDCGVCAVPVRRGMKLACVDGPVFEVRELLG